MITGGVARLNPPRDLNYKGASIYKYNYPGGRDGY